MGEWMGKNRVLLSIYFAVSMISTTALCEPIFIIGSGNVGSFLSLALSRTPDTPVKVISLTGKTNREIHLSGEIKSLLKTDHDTYTIPLTNWEESGKFPPNATIFLTNKAGELKEIGKKIRDRLDGTQTLVLLQNGIGIMDESPELASYSNKVRGMVLFGINTVPTSPTGIKLSGTPRVSLASLDRQLLDHVKKLMLSSHINVVLESQNVLEIEWKKALLNVYVNGLTALCDKTIGQVIDHEPSASVARKLLLEAKAIAALEGQIFSDADIHQVMLSATHLKQHSTSMREDLRSNRTTEAPWFYGHMVAIGKKHGVSIPVSEKVYRLLSEPEKTRANSDITQICGDINYAETVTRKKDEVESVLSHSPETKPCD